jgi:antirestriction protein ArdC
MTYWTPSRHLIASGVTDMKRDTYQTVTDRIVAALEAGTKPWRQPWAAGANGAPIAQRPLRANGQSYKGVNVLLLWSATQAGGYHSPYWFTYKQAQELGGQVRKGEHSEMVVYFQMLDRERVTAGGTEEVRIPLLREYRVFNADQIDGLPARFFPAKPVTTPTVVNAENVPDASGEAFFAATGSHVQHGGHRAFYQPSTDRIQMPALNTFESSSAYYATLAHEHVHWTMAPARLDREDFGRKRWGDSGYAMEELVAELGACFVCAELEMACDLDQSASYLAEWIKVMKADKRAIFTAASYAQKAADFLSAFSAPAEAEEEQEEPKRDAA